MYSPPDRPLVVKCAFDKWHKRITFDSARNCSYDVLRRKVEQCFSLYATSFAVSYKDDDGEITDISTDHDLIEAIQYFSAGDDVPISSAASILSGRSFGARKITLRVIINVEYDGPSLSDTSSLASLDDFKSKNGSQVSFSFGSPTVDLDDDSITVSSRDPGTSASRSVRSGSGSLVSAPRQLSSASSSSKGLKTPSSHRLNGSQAQVDPSVESFDIISHSDALGSTDSQRIETAAERFPEDPSAVFERLKLSESERHDDSSSLDYESVVAGGRGAAWIRDQNERAIRSMVGAFPEPSDSDGISLSLDSRADDQLGGDLALERDQRGKYYYTYTSSSSSHFQESVGDEVRATNSIAGDDAPSARGPRPTSMQLRWVAAQQKETASKKSRTNLQALSIQEETTDIHPHEIDKELLPFLPVAGPDPEILTDCSNCGILLEAIRYICSTCGEKAPAQSVLSEQAHQRDSPTTAYTYPPPQHMIFSSPNSSSSQTYIGSPDSIHTQRYKPLPSIPSATSLPYVQSMFNGSRGHLSPTPSSSSSGSVSSAGYELCSACIETVGIRHAIEGGLSGPGTPPVGNGLFSVHDDPQRAQQWRRTAPRKGQLRHAYQEKVWGHHGWEDVVLDEALVSKCSTCSAVTDKKRYKCTSCSNLHICRACYSQVHELHPTHAFLIIPDKPVEITTIPDFSADDLPDPNDETCKYKSCLSSCEANHFAALKHPGVVCAHCLLDIVGARFHCAICDSVDICSNCESAGLPGNLDSADGGHTSSHILIKIPYPLETTELQSASRRAVHLWQGRDAANVGLSAPRSKAESEVSYARTIIGGARSAPSQASNNHHVFCNGCGHLIAGIRYQCGSCPSSPTPFNLCSNCEMRSYVIHDPMHIFFKIPRPVHRSLESPFPLLPHLYRVPAGPAPSAPKTNDPQAYLNTLKHTSALCDRCMTSIVGVWFRCAYCARDLCDSCQEVDTHDDTHIFIVFKSIVDMQLFKTFAELESQTGSPPVIPYPIYR